VQWSPVYAPTLMAASRRSPNLRQKLTLGGETRSLAAWAKRVGVDSRLVRRRLKQGFSPEVAILTPTGPARLHGLRILLVGEEATLLAALGSSEVTVARRRGDVRRWLGVNRASGEADAVIVATDRLGTRVATQVVSEVDRRCAVALHGSGPLAPALDRASRPLGDRCWPMESVETLPRFLRFAAVLARVDDVITAFAVLDLATRWKVTPHLAQVMALATTGATTDDICRMLGVTPNTLKTHSRRLLYSAGVDSFDRLGKLVLRVALVRAQEHTLASAELLAVVCGELR